MLEIIIDYLNREHFVRVDNTSSRCYQRGTSRVLLGSILFCIFINDLPDVLKFSDPFIFADEFKFLAVGKKFWQVKGDLQGDQVKSLLNVIKKRLPDG